MPKPHTAIIGRMRPELLEIIVCPLCKARLELHTTAESDGDVLAGSLRCTGCGETFPIEDGIPNLLPPDLRET